MSTNNLIEQRIVDTLEKKLYALCDERIVSRAIPEIDGLSRPTESCFIQCIKWGCSPAKKTKSANVVGQT